ncbi:hypothetical protein V5N11_012550 [Cardamine amara subsp. amara]|uniref:Uncharacterized protein n=1 Tax=Cardamine amara subsp. amara TaxID=228776 RepID=A0ABD0ZH15_CARAN
MISRGTWHCMREEGLHHLQGLKQVVREKKQRLQRDVENGQVNASCSAAKTTCVKEFSEDELKELRTIIAETDANVLIMESGDLSGANSIDSCCVESIDDTSGTDMDLTSLAIDVPGPSFCDFDKDQSKKII